MAAEWEVTQNSGTGKRDNMVQQAFDMKPDTPAKTFILDKLLKSFWSFALKLKPVSQHEKSRSFNGLNGFFIIPAMITTT